MVSFISGFVFGGVVVYFIIFASQKGKSKIIESNKDLILMQEEKKRQNIEKLKEYIVKLGGKITNDQAQNFLKISDATAERYLDELESEGFIRQVGKTGISTYYKRS